MSATYVFGKGLEEGSVVFFFLQEYPFRLGLDQLDGSADRPLLDIWLNQLTSIVFFCKNIHGLLSIVAIQLRRCGLYIPYANLDKINKLPQDRPSEQRRRYEMLNVGIAGVKQRGS